MLKNKRTWLAGALVLAVAALVALTLPAGSAADKHEKPMMAADANHFKCHDVLDWGQWDPKVVALQDQFGKSKARVIEPRLLCNPVDKNGEGVADKDSHLVCYKIQDDPSGSTERVKEVTIRNQFQEGPLWVGTANLLCVPSGKSYTPRG